MPPTQGAIDASAAAAPTSSGQSMGGFPSLSKKKSGRKPPSHDTPVSVGRGKDSQNIRMIGDGGRPQTSTGFAQRSNRSPASSRPKSTHRHRRHRDKQSSAVPMEGEAFLESLHRTHPLHTKDEDPYYAEVIDKKLENTRKNRFEASVKSWKGEVEKMRVEWAEDRHRKDEEINLINIEANKKKMSCSVKKSPSDAQKERKRQKSTFIAQRNQRVDSEVMKKEWRGDHY